MTGARVIRGPACLEEGMTHLAACDPVLAEGYALTGALPLRLRPAGFAPLLEVILGQQVSTASARAHWARMQEAGLVSPDAVAAASPEELRACGLSRQKARYARALAAAGIDYDALAGMDSDAVIARLMQVTGIGRWTAEIYAMFSLGRADVFAPGDLALQEAARLLYRLPARPTARELAARAEAWAPWRSVAARLLWSYYSHEKQREGIA